MELNHHEAQMLAEPITPILQENNMQPPKWAKDLSKLIMAFSYVYAPRFKAIGERMKAEADAKKQRAAAAAERHINPASDAPFFAPTINPNAGPLGGIN